MLLFDLNTIGNNLLSVRKQLGMTQAEVAEKAGLSDRTYADIERGTVNMRLETLMRICQALHITPNDILTTPDHLESAQQADLRARLDGCNSKDKDTALRLVQVYLQSIHN